MGPGFELRIVRIVAGKSMPRHLVVIFGSSMLSSRTPLSEELKQPRNDCVLFLLSDFPQRKIQSADQTTRPL